MAISSDFRTNGSRLLMRGAIRVSKRRSIREVHFCMGPYAGAQRECSFHVTTYRCRPHLKCGFAAVLPEKGHPIRREGRTEDISEGGMENRNSAPTRWPGMCSLTTREGVGSWPASTGTRETQMSVVVAVAQDGGHRATARHPVSAQCQATVSRQSLTPKRLEPPQHVAPARCP